MKIHDYYQQGFPVENGLYTFIMHAIMNKQKLLLTFSPYDRLLCQVQTKGHRDEGSQGSYQGH